MKLAGWKMMAGGILAALLCLPTWGVDDSYQRRTAAPGTLNYVEGQASMADQALDSKSVGSATLQNGEILKTGSGKVEILLTPGVYLRLGPDSSVKMVSNSLTNTQLALNKGEAMLEVDELYSQNNIHITQPGADARVVKTGLYDFDANNGQVRVFDGRAVVNADDRNVTLKKGHELALNSDKVKGQKFDKKQLADSHDLYRWSSLRSQYLSEANVDTARIYYANGWYGPGWWGPGWYWNPWFAGFTFVPGGGFFYNPFGWGFYSPLVVTRAPVVIARGPHHFDGTRPVAIGHGFRNHALTSFRGSGMRGGMSPRPAVPHASGFSGVHSGQVHR